MGRKRGDRRRNRAKNERKPTSFNAMNFFKQLTDPALKRLYKFVLKRLIGRFLAEDEIDLDQLDVHLRSGRLELCDLRLNTEVLNADICEANGLPFRVKKGYLGSVRVTISYANIMSESCLVEIDDIEVVLVPVDADATSTRDNHESMTKSTPQNATSATPVKPGDKGTRARAASREEIDEVSQEGLDFVASWIEQVTSKIKVTLSNICLRIETGDMNVPNAKNVALLCKLEWAQFTDESASEVASVYGTMDQSQRMGTSQSMYQSMAASSLFGISQKAVKFRGISMDLLIPPENIGGDDNDMDAGAVLHPFLSSDSTRQCYVQLKLSHYEALETPTVDADIFLHSIRAVLQPQHFEHFGVLIDKFSDDAVVKACSAKTEHYGSSSAMFASICDSRPAWLNDDDDGQVAPGTESDQAALKLSLREFQRIEHILQQYHKTHTELMSAQRNRSSASQQEDLPYPVPRRLSIAESVESAGLSDLEDDESFFDCDPGTALLTGGESNLMAQSMYASALYDVDDASQGVTNVRASLRESMSHRGTRSVQNRLKLHLLETEILILYDDLPDHIDDDESFSSETRRERQLRRRRRGLPTINNEERLEISVRDVILSTLIYQSHVTTSLSIGKLEILEKMLARMSTVIEEDEEGALLSATVLRFADVSPITGRNVHLSSNISAQVRIDLKPDGQGVDAITVQVSTQPILLEWDMHLIDRAHRLMKLMEESSAARQKKMKNAPPQPALQYPQKLDINTECVEVSLRFPMVNSDLIRFGPSSRRGLSEDKLIVLLEGVKVFSYEEGGDKESEAQANPKPQLPWLSEFGFNVETVTVSMVGPTNGDQRSPHPPEKTVLITARGDETSGDSCMVRLRLQTPTNEQVRSALDAKHSISQDSLEQYLDGASSPIDVPSDSEEKSGDDNDGGRIGSNGWSQDARARAYQFEVAASAASLMDLEIVIPHSTVLFHKRSLDRLMVLFDALLMINPIDINGHNQMMASGAYRNRLIPSYMTMNLMLRDGTVQLEYHNQSKDPRETKPAFVYHLAFQDLRVFQVSQWMGQLVSRVQIAAQNVSLLEENCDSKETVPILYKNPIGQNDAPILFVGIDIIDQTQEMREMKVELHVSQLNLRYDVTSKWMRYLPELLLLEYPPPIIPLDSACITEDEYQELREQIETKTYEAVKLAVPPKSIFTKLFVSLYDAMVDYSPANLPSRLLLVLGNVSVSSNVVTGALIQGYKITLRDTQLFLTPEWSSYEEIDECVLGNELFVPSRRSGKRYPTSFAIETRSRAQLSSLYPSMLIYFEKHGFLQMVTMDFVDVFLRAIVPPLEDDGRQYSGQSEMKKVTPASLGSPELSVELNLGTANVYACFDSFNTLIELITDWTEQLNFEDEPRDTTAYVGLDRVKDMSNVSVVTNLGPATVRSSRPSSEDPSAYPRMLAGDGDAKLGGDSSATHKLTKGRGSSFSRTESASVASEGGINLFSLLDENAFGSDRRGHSSGQVQTDTEARLLRTRLDAIQKEKNKIVSGAPAISDDSLSAAELRRKYRDGNEKPSKPRIKIDDLFIEDYYAGERSTNTKPPTDAGGFLMAADESPAPDTAFPAADDPWFSSPPMNNNESVFGVGGGHPVGSLPEEHTARWLNPAARASSPGASSHSSSPRFDPVEESANEPSNSLGWNPGRSASDDEADEEDDEFPLGAFPAGPKNWWGMASPQDVELSELQTEETGSSFSHRLHFEDTDSVGPDESDEAPHHLSMSMIGTGADSGIEVELDFDVDGEMQTRFKKLLEMETTDMLGDDDEEEDSNGSMDGDGAHQQTSPRALIASFHQEASAPIPILQHHTSASENSTHSGAAPIISPPDEPTARWFYDDAAGDSLVRDGPPSRIYPHHVEIPIGGTAASLSFGERECDEAIRCVAREHSDHHPTATPVVIRHVLLRDFNICMRFFGGSDWSRDTTNAPTLTHRGVTPETTAPSSFAVGKSKDMAPSTSAGDKKKQLLDSLLDDYVPSTGKSDLFGNESHESSLFGGVRTASPHEQRGNLLSRAPVQQQAQRKRSLKSGRKTEEMLELVVTRIQLRLDVFNDEDSQPLASNTVLALGDIEILDYISTSQIRKIICYWKSDASHPRESGSSMVHVHLMTVRPGPNLCEEHRLKLRLLPLRINLDQDVVSFLRQFVPTEPASKQATGLADEHGVDDDGMPEVDGTELSALSSSPAPSRVTETDVSLGAWFFQSIEIRPCKIKIDYRPNRVDFQALRAGDYLEVINLFVLEGMELVLRRVKASGIDGWAALGEHVLMSWVSDISRHQIHKCVASVAVPPLRPFANIGSGAADLILLPLQQYDRDRRVVRGLKKGAKSFLKSVTIETLNTVSKVALGTQALLEHADDVVSSSATRKRNIKYRQPGSRIARNSKRMGGGGIRSAQDRGGIGSRQYLAQQPSNATEGLYQAYDSLSRELHTAAKTIVAVPLVEYKKTGSQGYVRSVIRAVPVAVLRPMIGASEAMSKAIIGVRNAVDPEMREDVENKFKDFRTI